MGTNWIRTHCKRAGLAAALIGAAALAVAVASRAADKPVAAGHMQATEKGYYRVALRPVPEVAPIAALHNWTVHVETPDGKTFLPDQLAIAGGMPAHGHGFATNPQVTTRLANGAFLIEGMKFHMPGDWQLIVSVSGPTGFDRAVFDLVLGPGPLVASSAGRDWTAGEIALLKTLALDQLDAPSDPSNRFSANQRAAALGQRLFFDPHLSASKTIACATCHDPKQKFTDGKKKSVGTRETARHAPSLIGAAHGKWFYWDGRRDSLWAQAITPIETPGEMDNTRVDAIRYVFTAYRTAYQAVAGDWFAMDAGRFPAGAGPFADAAGKRSWSTMQAADRDAVNRAFANVGKFLAAYIEQLQPKRARFDDFIAALVRQDHAGAAQILTDQEQAGLKLFLDGGRTQCLRCHNGPLLTNHEFHNIATGLNDDGALDFGRMIGLQAALVDEFNCQGAYSDRPRADCAELKFADPGHAARGAFKVPGLRNVAVTAPYMHDGRMPTLRAVLEFYTRVPAAGAGPHELPPLDLSAAEIDQLAAFLGTLTESAAAAPP